MKILVTKTHDPEQLVEELLEAMPDLRGVPHYLPGFMDAPDGFVVLPQKDGSTEIEFPSEKLAKMAEVVVEAHKPTVSKAEERRRIERARRESLRLSKDRAPTAREWADLLDHLGIR